MPILNNLSTNLPGFAGGQSQQGSTLGTAPNLGETGGIGAQGNNPTPDMGGGSSFNPQAMMQSLGGGAPGQSPNMGMPGMMPLPGGMPPPQIGNSIPMGGMPQGNPMFAAMMR